MTNPIFALIETHRGAYSTKPSSVKFTSDRSCLIEPPRSGIGSAAIPTDRRNRTGESAVIRQPAALYFFSDGSSYRMGSTPQK
jgi:hypothetical protein